MNEHSLSVGELEAALQVRNDDIVQASQEADHEEQRDATPMARTSI